VVGSIATVLAVALVRLAALTERRVEHLSTGASAPPSHVAARSSSAELLRHGARESATVTGWVAVAFLLTAFVTEGLGLDVSGWLTMAGVFGVLAGAAVGLIPGCAPQVLLTGLDASGSLPIATLVANAVSPDGDALFPLLMSERRAVVMASILTTLPALVIGVGVLLLWSAPSGSALAGRLGQGAQPHHRKLFGINGRGRVGHGVRP